MQHRRAHVAASWGSRRHAVGGGSGAGAASARAALPIAGSLPCKSQSQECGAAILLGTVIDKLNRG